MTLKITTSGKIFFGIIILVAILFLISPYLQNPNNSPIMTNIYCVPDCSPQSVPIGLPTLVKGCFINQTECQTAAQSSTQPSASENKGRILIGFNDSIHKVPGIGSVTMLMLNVTQIYIRENNQTDWVSILDSPKNFDITTLNNQAAVVVDTTVPVKTYSQEKIILGSNQIKIYSLLFNIYNKTYTLIPDSNETLLSYSFTPSTNAATLLAFDLSVENSVKHTSDGYVLSPQFTPSVSTFANDQQPANSILIN